VSSCCGQEHFTFLTSLDFSHQQKESFKLQYSIAAVGHVELFQVNLSYFQDPGHGCFVRAKKSVNTDPIICAVCH